jgi:hypothetical protein
MKEKEFVYFPSLSSGNSKDWLMKNLPLSDGTTSRFYCDTYPEDFRHKYFLVSAGHNLSKDTLRVDMGLEDSFVIGDSGGYQIMTGALKWKPEIKQRILTWLENNSDIAMNLDIPPRGKLWSYNESLDISIENFKYFADNRIGKTKLLNVLHGPSIAQYNHWYEKVKDFPFNGWSIGIGRNIYNMLYAISLLIEKGEFDKVQNEYLHLLGVASTSDFFIIGTLQRAFNKRFDNRVTLTTDSSSPNRATIFGTVYFDINYKDLKMMSNYFPTKKPECYHPGQEPFCVLNCPACKNATYDMYNTGDGGRWTEMGYISSTNHNMAITTQSHKVITKLLRADPMMIKEVVNTDYFQLYSVLEEIVLSPTPIATFHKYTHIINKVCNNPTNITTLEPDTFFNF